MPRLVRSSRMCSPTGGSSRRDTAAPLPKPYSARPAAVPVALAPDFGGGFDDEGEFGELLVVGEGVAFDGGGEAALGGQAQLVEGEVGGGLVDAAFEGVFGFQVAAFGGNQAQHDHLGGRDEPQRREPAGAVVVVFEEEAVHVQLAEQRLGDEVVAAFGG